MYEDECGYFKNFTAEEEIYMMPYPDQCRDMFDDADEDNDEYYQQLYFEELLERGWRRSGGLIYLNECPSCKKCIPIRIESEKFVPSKSQRHVLKKNSDIKIKVSTKPEEMITEEKVLLFKNYFKRHEDKEADTSFEKTKEILCNLNGIEKEDGKLVLDFTGTCNIDYYLNGKLIGVSVTDYCINSISSNYFYYDLSPEIMKRGIGTFSILTEILFCKNLINKKYYYLGYYVHECRKMNYKANFKPYQLYIDEKWVNYDEVPEEKFFGIKPLEESQEQK